MDISSLRNKVVRNVFSFDIEGYTVFKKDISFGGTGSPQESEVQSRLIPDRRFCAVHSPADPDFPALIRFCEKHYLRAGHNKNVRSLVASWLEDRQICYLVRDGARVHGMQWVAMSDSRNVPRFTKAYGIDDGECLVQRIFVKPTARGQQLQRKLLSHSISHLREHQLVRRLLAYVGANNLASTINMSRDFDEFSVIYHVAGTLLSKEFDVFFGRTSQWKRLRV